MFSYRLLFIIALCFSSGAGYTQCISATDCDGDGVPNSLDEDDDNDGIVDIEECNANISLGGLATMSSTFGGLIASNANNGTLAGDLAATSGISTNDWLDLDLGTLEIITALTVVNRTVCCSDRLSNVFVLISNVPFPVSTSLAASQAVATYSFQFGNMSGILNAVAPIPSGTTGRYVRLQKSGVNPGGNIINIHELIVTGAGAGCNPDVDGDGIQNSFDLDTDNDSCNDVTEAGFTDQDADGVLGDSPIVVNGVGRVIGTSVVDGYTGTNTLVSDITYIPLGVGCDTDGDGVSPIIDTDDDNDGILDVIECSQSTVAFSSGFEPGDPVFNVCGGSPDYLPAFGVTSTNSGASALGLHPHLANANVPFETVSLPLSVALSYGELLEVSVSTANQSGSIGWLPHGSGYFDVYGGNGFCVLDQLLFSTSIRPVDVGWFTEVLSSVVTVSSLSHLTFVPLGVSADPIIDLPYMTIDDLTINVVTCIDTDGDFVEDHLDLDSDNDGCFDVLEAGFTDQNQDGVLGDLPLGVDFQGNVVSTSVADGYSGTNASVTDFIPSGPCQILLPVSWCGFSIRQKECSHFLEWSTCSEKDVSYFEVQLSLNGKDWETVKVVEAVGNSSTMNNYSSLIRYEDSKKGGSYYRVKQSDFNGSFTFSPTGYIDFKACEGTSQSIFSLKDLFESKNRLTLDLLILESAGREVFSGKSITKEDIWSIENEMAYGYYYIIVNNEEVLRFIYVE